MRNRHSARSFGHRIISRFGSVAPGQFPLQPRDGFPRSDACARCSIPPFSLLGIATASAQEQDRKLLDRLLKPDMSLSNKEQDKQFTAGGATIDKKARTKSFYVQDRRAEKQFVTGRFSHKTVRHQFVALSAAGRRTFLRTSDRGIWTSATQLPVIAMFGRLRKATLRSRRLRSAARVHSSCRGKSQKALSQQDKPLTIDQVRELLNKNK